MLRARGLGGHLTDEVSNELARRDEAQTDPALRLAHAYQGFLDKAQADPRWGWLIVRLAERAGPMAEATKDYLHADLRSGVESGRFQFGSSAAAQDLVIGTALAAMRTLLGARAGPEHGRQTLVMVLCALGLACSEAEAIAR